MTDHHLSPNFTLAELTVSETAARRGLKNSPTLEEKLQLRQLAKSLEVIRKVLGSRPITILSGFRSAEVNDAVGGARDSDHMYGCAADFICPAYGTPREVCLAIKASGIPFRQVILEYDRWVHFSIPRPGEEPKNELLTVRHGTGYLKGIQ